MSFLASRIMRAASGPRAGMELWWKSHIPVNGLITRHLSPFEVKVLEPLGKNFEKKTWARVRFLVVATLFSSSSSSFVYIHIICGRTPRVRFFPSLYMCSALCGKVTCDIQKSVALCVVCSHQAIILIR